VSGDGSKAYSEGHHHVSANPPEQGGSSEGQVFASSPVLKAWLDRVIVPALVCEYLAGAETETPCSPKAGCATMHPNSRGTKDLP
jgi:hypothetical protein